MASELHIPCGSLFCLLQPFLTVSSHSYTFTDIYGIFLTHTIKCHTLKKSNTHTSWLNSRFDAILIHHFSLKCPPYIFLQYDYMERLDGKEKWSVVESPRERRSIQTVVLNEAVFVQYLDAGAWHLAFYNDGRERETVSFSTNIMGESI